MTVQSDPLFLAVSEVPTPVASIVGNVVSASPVAGASFQWYFNGEPLVGGTSASVAVTLSGDYHVVATVAGCASEASNTVVYELTTGLLMHEVHGFQLVPNPTDGPLTIRGTTQVLGVELWNAAGQKVLEQRGTALDLEPFAPGLYTVVLHTRNERLQLRVLKQ